MTLPLRDASRPLTARADTACRTLPNRVGCGAQHHTTLLLQCCGLPDPPYKSPLHSHIPSLSILCHHLEEVRPSLTLTDPPESLRCSLLLAFSSKSRRHGTQGPHRSAHCNTRIICHCTFNDDPAAKHFATGKHIELISCAHCEMNEELLFAMNS